MSTMAMPRWLWPTLLWVAIFLLSEGTCHDFGFVTTSLLSPHVEMRSTRLSCECSPKQQPVIETARLVLRDWHSLDREKVAAINADPEIMRYSASPLTRNQSDALVDRFIARGQQDGITFWATEEKNSGAFLGMVGMAVADLDAPFAPAVEIGWRLARSAWGKGYATEAASGCLAHAFGSLGLEEVVSFTVPTNVRSRAVMERLGMERDASRDFDHPLYPEGHELQRHVLYSMTRQRWLRNTYFRAVHEKRQRAGVQDRQLQVPAMR